MGVSIQPNIESVAVIEGSKATQQAPASDPLQGLDAATKQQLLLKFFAEFP